MIFIILALTACASTTILPSSTPTPQGRTLIVTSAADSGPGTLRQALLDAQNGDTIILDPAVFPPDAPVTIFTTSELPHIRQGNLTIDASNAGVILDGSKATNPTGDWLTGLQIVDSDANVIRGLHVTNFTGPGIAIAGEAKHNIVGGDRSIGNGPFGQGNMLTFNDIGVHLKSTGTTLNTVMGNLIGTDVSGAVALGNKHSGVFISEGANRNTIGPDNIIAHNAEQGVCIAEGAHSNTVGPDNVISHNGAHGIIMNGLEAVRNTITRNSLHDNVRPDIALSEGGNAELAPPKIFDLDSKMGTLTGVTCANCIVEIFSDQSNDGAIYEGQAIADEMGIFTFSKGASFTGPHLTATVTDPDGNTSGFSRPLSTLAGVMELQQGNDSPNTLLQVRESRELADNRMGLFWGDLIDTQDWDDLLFQLNAAGVQRANVPLFEGEPPIDWNAGSEFVIPAEVDKFIDGLVEHGIKMNLILFFWDKDGHARGEELGNPRFRNDVEAQEFLDFVRFIVRHFKGRIPYYTIWAEPDACGTDSIKCILPKDYIELARQVIPVIREEDLGAKVITAPHVLFFAHEDFFTILRSDVISQFGVVAFKTAPDFTPNHEYFGNYYYEYPSIIQEIKQTASAHGFTGEFWGIDLLWKSYEGADCHTPGCLNPGHPWDYLETNLQTAKYFARGTIMELGMDVVVGVKHGLYDLGNSPWSYPTIVNLNTVMAGNKPLEIAVEIENDATNLMSFGFSLPDGDRLFAVWTNGVAVDDDPGVNSTLTFPGTSVTKVIGVDVLHGFEQELIFEIENGNLVIRNFLIKDYPISLRLVD